MLAKEKALKIDENKLNHVALKAFFNITKKWGPNDIQKMILLGLTNKSTYYNYRRELKGRLPRDTLERISYILGIYKALHILLPYSADKWIKQKNPIFNDKTPLEIMLQGNVADLFVIRRYLDTERGALYTKV